MDYPIKVFSEVRDGNDSRLTLRVTPTPSPTDLLREIYARSAPQAQGYNFHSLVWDVRVGNSWERKALISMSDFAGEGVERFVNQLHSLNASSSTAVVSLAETDGWKVNYSWVEICLMMPGRWQMLRRCQQPFERCDEV